MFNSHLSHLAHQLHELSPNATHAFAPNAGVGALGANLAPGGNHVAASFNPGGGVVAANGNPVAVAASLGLTPSGIGGCGSGMAAAAGINQDVDVRLVNDQQKSHWRQKSMEIRSSRSYRAPGKAFAGASFFLSTPYHHSPLHKHSPLPSVKTLSPFASLLTKDLPLV